MSNLRNKVILIGNIGDNPALTTFESGNKVCKISLATNEVYKNDKKEKVTSTTWHTLVFWNKTAEILEKFCKKGSEIAIEGKLSNGSYEDKDGIKRYTTEIIVSELVLLNTK